MNNTDVVEQTGENTLEERLKQAAAKSGVFEVEVETLPFDLSVLEEDGVFVNVDAQGFRILDRRVDWESMGITLPQNSALAFRPPMCGLLPDRYRLPLVRPAARAHRALRRYSYTFTITETLFETPSYRWVPWQAFETFEQEFQQCQKELQAAREAVLANYDAVHHEVIDTFVKLAVDSARRLQATGGQVPEDFRERVIRGVERIIPSREAIQNKLTLRFRVGVLMLGSEMLAERRKAIEERRKLEEAEACRRVAERRLQEEEWAEVAMIRARVDAQRRELEREAEIKERLRRLKLEAARERMREALNPLEESLRQMRAAVYDAAVAIRDSMAKRQQVSPQAAKKAARITQWFKLMNWQNDEQLNALLSELETLSAQKPSQGDDNFAAINQVLSDVISLCYADAKALTEQRRMAALEL